MVDVLEEPHVGSPMKSLSLEIDDHGLAIRDLKEGLQVVPLHLLGVVEYI